MRMANQRQSLQGAGNGAAAGEQSPTVDASMGEGICAGLSVYVQHVFMASVGVRHLGFITFCRATPAFPQFLGLSRVILQRLRAYCICSRCRLEALGSYDCRKDVHLQDTLGIFGTLALTMSQDAEGHAERSCHPMAQSLLSYLLRINSDRERTPCSCLAGVWGMQEPVPVGRSKRWWRLADGDTNRRERQ